eukprot:SAG31_NODE_19146_length_610_cov_102.780822_2_plen_54_part_01
MGDGKKELMRRVESMHNIPSFEHPIDVMERCRLKLQEQMDELANIKTRLKYVQS